MAPKKLTEADKLCLGMWKEAYIAVLPALVAANPDGDPTRRATELAAGAVTALSELIAASLKDAEDTGTGQY